MAPETVVVERWLYGLLSGDTALAAAVSARIYGYVAPLGTAFPLVIFQTQGGLDVRGVGPTRIMSDLTVVVKAIDRAEGFGTLATIAARIDALLQGASGAATGGLVISCVREQPFSLVEVIDGAQYRHLGGIYRIAAQGA